MDRTREDIQDELLLLRCQDGEAEAFRKLFSEWQPRLVRLAMRLTGNAEVARDLAQDTWIAIVRGLRRLDDPARFRAWAYRILTNRCTDWTRRQAVRRNAAQNVRNSARAGSEAATASSPSPTADGDDIASLRVVLAEMSEQDRAVLSLFYLDRMRVAEIAAALGIPAGTIKSRLYHARNRLRDALERTKS